MNRLVHSWRRAMSTTPTEPRISERKELVEHNGLVVKTRQDSAEKVLCQADDAFLSGQQSDATSSTTLLSDQQPGPTSSIKSPRGFLDLPLELRQMIYKHALPARGESSGVPALLQCNLQICQEASSLCVRELSIDYCSGLDCIYPGQDRQHDQFKRLGQSIKRAAQYGQPVKLTIEVLCSGGVVFSKSPLGPLIDIVEAVPTLRVEVVAHHTACLPCSQRNPETHRKGAAIVKDMIDRVVATRDNGYIRPSTYLTPSFR